MKVATMHYFLFTVNIFNAFNDVLMCGFDTTFNLRCGESFLKGIILCRTKNYVEMCKALLSKGNHLVSFLYYICQRYNGNLTTSNVSQMFCLQAQIYHEFPIKE